MPTVSAAFYQSPVGTLRLEANEQALTNIHFQDQSSSYNQQTNSQILSRAIKQLEQYFNGDRTSFSIPLAPEGTSFQQQVWQQLNKIPYGQTISYGELAERLGNPNKVRAVGTANGKNPIPIIIPCHRVIGADHSLVGYSGGIERKKFLLQHERAILL